MPAEMAVSDNLLHTGCGDRADDVNCATLRNAAAKHNNLEHAIVKASQISSIRNATFCKILLFESPVHMDDFNCLL